MSTFQVVKERKPWHVKDGTGSPQVAGFVKQYKQLTLTTIRVRYINHNLVFNTNDIFWSNIE